MECTNNEDKGLQIRFKTEIAGAVKRVNFNVFCAEYIFGIISPNNNSKNVRMTVITINCNTFDDPKFIHESKKKFRSMIIVTFTKLFDIRIVASKRSESSSNAIILASEGCFSSSISLLSFGDNEKKAISEAETKPEANNNNIAKIKAIIAPMEGVITVTPSNKFAKWHKYESGSKELGFS